MILHMSFSRNEKNALMVLASKIYGELKADSINIKHENEFGKVEMNEMEDGSLKISANLKNEFMIDMINLIYDAISECVKPIKNIINIFKSYTAKYKLASPTFHEQMLNDGYVYEIHSSVDKYPHMVKSEEEVMRNIRNNKNITRIIDIKTEENVLIEMLMIYKQNQKSKIDQINNEVVE